MQCNVRTTLLLLLQEHQGQSKGLSQFLLTTQDTNPTTLACVPYPSLPHSHSSSSHIRQNHDRLSSMIHCTSQNAPPSHLSLPAQYSLQSAFPASIFNSPILLLYHRRSPSPNPPVFFFLLLTHHLPFFLISQLQSYFYYFLYTSKTDITITVHYNHSFKIKTISRYRCHASLKTIKGFTIYVIILVCGYFTL